MVGIIVFLASLLLFGYLTQLKKSRDGKRKSDMERIKVAFEDYFNDNGCYPSDVTMFVNCGSESPFPDGFAPWLRVIPCDPLGQPYEVVVEDSVCPTQFAVYTNMEYVNDPQTIANECFSGCLLNGQSYNFGISSGNITPDQLAELPEGEPSPTPTSPLAPTPTLDPSLCGNDCYQTDDSGMCNVTGSCSGEGCFASSASCSGDDCCNEACQVDSCPL